jgi:hypothetical protein
MNYEPRDSGENNFGGEKSCGEEGMNRFVCGLVVLVGSASFLFGIEKPDDAPTTSVVGYLRDSGCVHRFHEVMKPLPNGCLEACVKAGSPLVLLSKDEEVFHPVSEQMPDVDVRSKLLPFAGKLVRITGKVYDRGGSKAITVERIEEVRE